MEEKAVSLEEEHTRREANAAKKKKKKEFRKEHTTPGIRWSSPTQLLVWPSLAYLWESGRDPEFSSGYGRMCLFGVKLGFMKGREIEFVGGGVARRLDE